MSGVDQNLVLRIKLYLKLAKDSRVTEEATLAYLLDKYPKEYRSKPRAAFAKGVAKALRRAKGEAEGGGGGEGSAAAAAAAAAASSKKRARTPRVSAGGGASPRRAAAAEGDGTEASDVSEDEQEGRAADRAAAAMAGAGGGGNLLNQSMRAKYKKTNGIAGSGGGGGVPDGVGGADGKEGVGNAAVGDTAAAAVPAASGTGGSAASSGTAKAKREGGTSGRRSAQKRPRPSYGGSGGPRAAPRPGMGMAAPGSHSFEVERPHVRYSDLGGVASVLREVRELIEYPLNHPEIYMHLGIEPPRGILLHGPPGCGKTLLANAIAGELGVPFLKISAPEVVTGLSGESEQKLRDLFAAAVQHAPCIVFMDEVDAITPKREGAARGMEKRIVAQLLTCMDSLSMAGGVPMGQGQGQGQGQAGEASGGGGDEGEGTEGAEGARPRGPVMVIGATNRPNDLDSALRRAGRFDREICLGVPDQAARARILQVMSARMRLDGAFDFDEIARQTPGFVGADLSSLTKEAAVVAVNRIFKGLLPDTHPSPVTPSTAGGVGGTAGDGVSDMAVDPPAAADQLVVQQQSPAEQSASAPLVSDLHISTPNGGPRGVSGLSLHEREEESPPLEERTGTRDEEVAGKRLAPLTAEQLAPLFVTMADFLAAVKKVQPSAKREGFATVPNVSWVDVGALGEVREELSLSILEPITRPERYEQLGLVMPAGVLLYGPPGCGKTLLAKAIASESGVNFISVKGPELLDKYVGESEKAVRGVFGRARASSPCIVFFDEMDALCPRRGSGGEGGGGVSERVVNQLLTEMDGLEARRGVFVVAATNRPELIDPAMLRPGRLDKLLYVPLPTPHDRVDILKSITRNASLAADVDLSRVGLSAKAEGYSGADLSSLLREAGMDVLRQLKEDDKKKKQKKPQGKEQGKQQGAVNPVAGASASGISISMANFERAFLRVQPSVSAKDGKMYAQMSRRLAGARAHGKVDDEEGGGGEAAAAAAAAAGSGSGRAGGGGGASRSGEVASPGGGKRG